MAENYDIRVRGHLNDRWSKRFDGATLRRQADGTTVLSVTVADQAALYGVISQIRDLGLPLISVLQTPDSDNTNSRNVGIGGCQHRKNS